MLEILSGTLRSPLAQVPIDFGMEVIRPSSLIIAERKQVQIEENTLQSGSGLCLADGSPSAERVAAGERLKLLLPHLQVMCEPALNAYGIDRAINEGVSVLTRLGWMPGLSRVLPFSAEDEVVLFRAMNASVARAGSLIRGLGIAPEKRDLQAACEALSVAARFKSAIVESNMPLVLAMTKRSSLPGMDYDEMISEGNLVLLRSMEKFDWTRGYKFSTYACRSILRALAKIALQTARRHVRFIQDNPEQPPVDEEHSPVSEAIAHERGPSHAFLQAGLRSLEPAQKRVLVRRFNLDGAGRKTLQELGEELGLSKERVRQIQQAALSRLRELADKEWGDKL